MEAIEKISVEEVGRGRADRETDTPLTLQIEGAKELHAHLAKVADSMDVGGFQCIRCGLVHGHDTTKHTLSSTFGISEEEAAGHEYNPNCHGGLHEAAIKGDSWGIDASRAKEASRGAPIPDHIAREMR